MKKVFEKRSPMPVSREALFAYHARPGAFGRLTPPWEKSRLIAEIDSLRDGARAILDIAIGPVTQRYVALHENVQPGRGFDDRQVEGPFASWVHEHRFEEGPDGTSLLHDRVTYDLPRLPLADLLGGSYASERLERMFTHRHATTRLDLELGASLPETKPLTVAITGASGLVGKEIASLLSVLGHRVKRFVRGETRAKTGDIRWDAQSGVIDAVAAADVDVVVHLAGEPLLAGRLTDARRQRIIESRVDATERLIASLAKLQQPPDAFVSASAVGFYGDRGVTIVDETSGAGTGFLADVCRRWEAAAQTAASFARVCCVRIGVVLSPAGGALAQMLPAFSAGAGGTLGDGHQGTSLIAIDDLGALFARAVVDERLTGAYNGVMQVTQTNAVLTATLGRVLQRPALLRVPKTALRLAMGELADEALLASCFAVPRAAEQLGHRFRHATLEDALRHVLGK